MKTSSRLNYRTSASKAENAGENPAWVAKSRCSSEKEQLALVSRSLVQFQSAAPRI